MKMKNKLLFVLVFILIVLTLHNVSSIEITPGRTTLNFEPGLHKEVVFSIINSEHKDMSVVFVVRGDLSEVVTLTQTYAEFSSSEESKSFSYLVDLPEKIEKPGLYETEIVALEMPKDIKGQGIFVGASDYTDFNTATQLHIYIPYPNKYAEAEVNIMESDGKTIFLVPVINRGKIDIVDVKAVIDIYTSLNEKVTTIESNAESLDSLKRKELVAEWTENINPGKYLAVVTVIYDNEVFELEKEFRVGEMALEIKEITIENFQLGEIAKFDALVENKLSIDLKDVYLNIIVYNSEGEIMTDFKSLTYDIKSLSKFEMVSYWNTAGVKEGTYDGKIILKSSEGSTEKNIQVKITDDSIEVTGLTGSVVVSRGGKFNLDNRLIILVIFLIIINIIWFVVTKRMMQRK